MDLDYVALLHEDLGNHYQLIMRNFKNDISPEVALKVAGMLTSAQNQAAYISALQQEIALLRQTIESKKT